MLYFDHDTTAASDDLIMALRLKHGGAAVDCYWAILEQIYRDERPTAIVGNRPQTQALSARLALGLDTLKEYVSTMVSYGLLEADETCDGGYENVVSRRAMENIEAYRAKCEKNRLNGQKGGRKTAAKTDRKANAKRTIDQSESERQANKRKEKQVMGLDKLNPLLAAEHGADAGEPAPRSARSCERCGGEMQPTSSFVSGTRRRLWRCEKCGEEAADE